ncbi:hypothetical protein PFISCL1PPCAC_11069 [Pristionchus fissidentatus]|uniref:Uncharacterized protein n=1 Tax=Pristionchus fissidentatus TaxID=1538716 RepID=A0AAV5VM28_9BILA|nr:hypothetical protein PFISCL1PPCAC_11069 [Pristionchus fissidentatus]
MADPLSCLRSAAIVVGIWNIIYACIMIGVMGWQTQVVKDLMGYWENREIPDNALIYSDFKARFPGLYGLYTETPERRRVNAMYPIVIISLILAIAHLPISCLLVYAAIKRRKNFIWPYFLTGAALVIMSTAYAVLWWSGDVFTEQLVMSVSVFVMSIAISAPGWCAVLFFYIRLNGQLQSGRPAKRGGSGRRRPYDGVPAWRTEWTERPPKELEMKIRRDNRSRREKEMRRLDKESEKIESERRRMERERRREEEERTRRYQPFNNGNVDYYVPRANENTFPWNSPIPRAEPEPPRRQRKKSAAEVIENLYYEHYPEDMPKQVGALRREQY